MTHANLLYIEQVSKRFPGVQALDDVSFDVTPGEVHALVGENGAGKSTLMKILAGVYQPDAGQLLWDGTRVEFSRPSHAQEAGISIIYQEFNLLPDLSVAENILLKREPCNRFGLIDWRKLNEEARDLLQEVEADISPHTLVYSLTIAQQQIVEIVKALVANARLIIMDEPTAALNPTEVRRLFTLIERLKAAGKAVIFISHRLEEVLQISDRVTVLKDGKLVRTQPADGLHREEIVRQMVGRSLQDIFPPRRTRLHDKPLVEVRGLSTDRLRDIEFNLYPGEILGLAGLEGQGQREVARSLFGLEDVTGGEVRIDGKSLKLRDPRRAIRAGIAFISDDRKGEGLALRLGVRENVVLPSLGDLTRLWLTNPHRERRVVKDLVKQFGVKTPSIEQPVRFLSGGNQQKAVLSKWMIRETRLIIFVEPTRGIDIGAKVEIYQLMHDLAEKGAGVLVVSSELLELLGMSTRVIVLKEGAITAELPGEQATEENLMTAATGGNAL